MKNYTELKTFADACKIEKLDPKKVIPTFSGYPARDKKAMIAHAKLVIIARAANRLANGGKTWTPDWNNSSQYKYYPWFYMSGSFRFYGYDNYWYTYSLAGARLCFISSEVAEYIGNQFIDLYKTYFVI